MSDPRTISIYDAQAKRYAERTDQKNKGARGLIEFIAAVPAGGRVLDLGCGPGTSAAEMARAGLVVDASDASAEMVDLAASHPGVTVSHARFEDLSGQNIYDGIWANFSLLHAKRADLPTHLKAIHQALKPGGVFFVALKLGQGEGPDRIGRFYTYYQEDELKTYLNEAGFTVTGQQTGSATGLDGSDFDWIRLTTHA